MRHGPAEDEAGTGRDFDRKLTSNGRARTELVARELGVRGERPKHVVSSPLRRTIETAEVVVATLGLDLEIEVRDELAPGGNAPGLVRELASAGAKRVMLIGHEPDVSALTAHLFPTWSRGFDKAMVVGLKIERGGSEHGAAKCRFVIEPKRIGDQTTRN
jgi:phosphohistidine phosphatase